MLSTRYSRQFLMELEGSRQILEKYYQISRKSVTWEPSCSMRTETDAQMDGQDEAKSRFSQIC
jgi:hypothetical protein